MDKKLEILIIEDDEKVCNSFVNCCDRQEDIALVGCTNNSYTGIEILKEYLPDAVILDLELQQGGGDGITFLKNLQSLMMPIKPYVLITTHNYSLITQQMARAVGADFIMTKDQEKYSEESVLDFLLTLKPIIHKNRVGKTQDKLSFSKTQQIKRVNTIISLELDKVGVNPKAVGYRYLMDAIRIVIKEPTHGICSMLAKEYGKTETSVERAMQNAINKAWHTCDIDDLLKNYTAKISSDKGVPTITEFIYYYANNIKNRY